MATEKVNPSFCPLKTQQLQIYKRREAEREYEMRVNLLSYIGGLFSTDLAKKAMESLLGEGIGIAKEYATDRLKIQKGGKGLEDEIIFAEITLDSGLLEADYQKKLDEFLSYLKKHDKKYDTKRHEDFILFIAKGAEVLRKEKTYPDGEGKGKKVIEKEIRVTGRGINFIKSMIDYSDDNRKRIEFCVNRRVFDENIENRRKKVNSILGEAEGFVFTQLKIKSWKELNLNKLKAYDRLFARKIESARLKINPDAKRGKAAEIPGMLELATFGLSRKLANKLKEKFKK